MRNVIFSRLRGGALLLCLAATTSRTGAQNALSAPVPPAANAAPQAVMPPPNFLEQMENAAAGLIRQARPGVVSLEGRLLSFSEARQMLQDSDLSHLPGMPREEIVLSLQMAEEAMQQAGQNETGKSVTGSGFLISDDFVVTTAEVAALLRDPSAVFADGRRVPVEWVNADRNTNIAVLKLKTAVPNRGLRWGDSERVRAGCFALTIGNQGGFPQSASLGMIAGTHRAGRAGRVRYESLFQFQGAVGAGGSGSPLLDSRGELIGMIVAMPPPSRPQIPAAKKADEDDSGATPPPPAPPFLSLSNTGFALPASELKPVVELLCRHEFPIAKFGWLGISLPRPSLTDEPQEARLQGIYADSPAEKAGLLPDDLIIAFNGQPIRSAGELRALARWLSSGAAITLQIRRGGETRTLPLTTEPRPDPHTLSKMHLRPLAPRP